MEQARALGADCAEDQTAGVLLVIWAETTEDIFLAAKQQFRQGTSFCRTELKLFDSPFGCIDAQSLKDFIEN